MSTEHNFLIKYGLHNFVAFSQHGGKNTFTIQGVESQKMIRHAASLIEGRYGRSAHIQVS